MEAFARRGGASPCSPTPAPTAAATAVLTAVDGPDVPTFNAATDEQIRRAQNMEQVVAHARQAGYRVEVVWIVTDLEPGGVTIPPTPADGPVSVPVYAPRAARGTHDWNPDYDVGDALSDLFGR